MVQQLGLEKAKAVATLGSNEKVVNGEQALEISPAKLFRSVCTRGQFLAQDYPLIQFANMECAKYTKEPTLEAMAKLERFTIFLIGSPRFVWGRNPRST